MKKKKADQLRGYHAADLAFVFTYTKSMFSHNKTHISLKQVFPMTWFIVVFLFMYDVVNYIHNFGSLTHLFYVLCFVFLRLYK